MRYRRIVTNILTFSNVFSLYGARFWGGTVTHLHLWSGEVFKVVNTNNNLGTILEVFADREYRDLEALRGVPSPTLIDIGANIGTFTVWALRMLPTARIFSYEPERVNHELLIQNIRLNTLEKRALAYKAAVGGTSGERSLSIAGESSGKNSVSFQIGSGVSEMVPCTTLDAIFQDNHIVHCDCLKIDCEGAEYELLYNASAGTLKAIDMIIVEYHGVAGENPEELKSFLQNYGFVIEPSQLFPSMFTARRVI